MDIIKISIPHPKAVVQYFRDAKTVDTIKKEMGELKVKTQHMIDIMSGMEDTDEGVYKGNEYRTYRKAVNAINSKYNGTAKWGVLQTGNIIDLRAAFIISMGPKVSARDKDIDATNEIKWAKAFFEYNDLDKEMVQEFAKEAEIEGRILIKIDMDKTPEEKIYEDYGYQMVATRYVSWTDKKYTVLVEEKDYKKYLGVEWEGKNPGKLPADRFVYKKFGGRVNDPNTAQSKVMKCLTQIDNLDKALRDWREIDRIFSGPILYMKCEDKNDVSKALDAIDNKDFKIKKILAGTGELSFVSFDIKGIEALEKEILTNAKIVSGTTGVSVQYLGFVELLKNRSTSDDLREMLSSATVKERATWEGTYEELLTKAMNLFNKTVYAQKEATGKKLNPSLIKVNIPVITKQHWTNLEKVWLPAVIAGKITEELFLEQLPDVDVDKELKRKEKKEESEVERMKKDAEEREAEDLEAKLNQKGGDQIDAKLQ